MIYEGSVKLFKSDPEKLFGFIVADDGDIFFHWRRGGFFVFDFNDYPSFTCQQDGLTIPTVGSKLAFEYDTGPRGKRVVRWGHLDNYKLVCRAIDERKLYRLVFRVGELDPNNVFDQSKLKFETLWEGKNLKELNTGFGKEAFPIIDNGNEATYFEVFDGKDSWLPVDKDIRDDADSYVC